VLTAFRDNADKVAAAVAECRRLGIAVLPPDVHRSHLEFTVEGDAIRFGLLAVKNVGGGAIESIVAARETGPFRSLADFCARVDLRLVNKRVLESLIKVGALADLGHAGALLAAVDDVLAAAQADQRERATGQIGFFDLAADPGALERALPDASEIPVRERLRWEKELLGLYLSDHPLGEVAEQIGRFVNVYSGDLRDESLDGQRVVVGGIVTGLRTVITKAKATMGVATLEDLQGTVEIVVFPRLYEQTAGTWLEGAILLVAGRVDHRGEEVSLLADLVTDLESAVRQGEEAFVAEVMAGDRGRPRGRPGANGSGRPGAGRPIPAAARVVASPSAEPVAAVSPLRDGRRAGDVGGSVLPAVAASQGGTPRGDAPAAADGIAPPEPVPGVPGPPDLAAIGPDAEEPPLPDEARDRAVGPARAPTVPTAAGPGRRLHVRFHGGRGPDQLQAEMAAVRDILRGRPGGTAVVVHLPQGAGRPALPMELRSGVAYDAELVAEIGRRLGPGAVDLDLAADGAGAGP
jgi:hypothetical protein